MFRFPPHRQKSRVEDLALPIRTRHHLCREEVAPAGSQQLRAQDSAPAHRCGTERRTWHQGREGRKGDGNRDEGGDGREYKHGDEHEGGGES